MNGLRALLYVACFAGLAATAAIVTARVAEQDVTLLLLVAVAAGSLAGAPGLVRRRAWPLAVFLLPLGAYLLARALVPAPPQTGGAGAHLAFYAGQLQAGAVAYARDVFPLDVDGKAGLQLLLSLVVYAAVGTAAFLALSLRRPLPAIVILLALAGFGFTIDGSARHPWPALAFVLLAGSMLAVSRSLKRERLRATDALAGGVTAIVAVLLALSIMGTTTVEAGRPLRDWRQWDIFGAGTAHFRFDLMQNYPRLLDPAEDEVVMRVRSAVPMYWRANVLEEFNGLSWRGAAPEGRKLRPGLSGDDWVYEVPPAQPAPQGRLVTERFQLVSTYTDRLFAGGWPTEVRTSLPLDLRTTGAAAIAIAPPRGPTLEYSVTAVVPDLGPTDLIGRGRYYPKDVVHRYLGLPFPPRPQAGDPAAAAAWRDVTADPDAREWVDLPALNDRIVGAETDPYRVALAVEQYLRTNYDYSLRPPSAGYYSPYAEFLFATRTGYCQHFAGAMAALLRFNRIPARVVVGFTAGKEEGSGVWVVTRNDAHSWVEAYFPGVGWAPFDPTPGRRIPSTGDAPANGPDAAAAAGLGDVGASLPAAGAREAGQARVADPGGPGAQTAQTVSAEASARLPLALAFVAMLALWPAGRALLRRRGLVRGSSEERLRASVSLLYADLRAYGVDAPASQTLDETARYLDEQLGVDAGDLPARVQAVVFGGREATPADLAAVADLRRRVRRRLRERVGWAAAVLALYGIHPPSVRRRLRRPGDRIPHHV